MTNKQSSSKIDMVNYFGEHYWEKPTKFEFEPGDVKLIKALVAHIKQIFDAEDDIKEGVKRFAKGREIKSIECNIQQKQKPVAQSIDESIRRSHYFLNKLISAANRNGTRKPGGFRYDNDIKLFALYIRLLTGPLAYATIQKNLECCLPSLPSVNRYMGSSSCHILEGILRSDELLVYLNERNLPLVVSIAEDETRIVGRVQYDAKTNQIIGFTLPLNEDNGIPIPFSYPDESS